MAQQFVIYKQLKKWWVEAVADTGGTSLKSYGFSENFENKKESRLICIQGLTYEKSLIRP